MSNKPIVSKSSYSLWRHHPITEALMNQVKVVLADEAVATLSSVNPSRKDVSEIALTSAFQAGRQSVLEIFSDPERIKETFLSIHHIEWEE